MNCSSEGNNKKTYLDSRESHGVKIYFFQSDKILDFISKYSDKLILSGGLFYVLYNIDLQEFYIFGNYQSTGFSLQKIQFLIRSPIMMNLSSYWVLKIAQEYKILKKETCQFISRLVFGASLLSMVRKNPIFFPQSVQFKAEWNPVVTHIDVDSYYDRSLLSGGYKVRHVFAEKRFFLNLINQKEFKTYEINLLKYNSHILGALGFHTMFNRNIEPAINDLLDDSNSSQYWNKISTVAIISGFVYYFWNKI